VTAMDTISTLGNLAFNAGYRNLEHLLAFSLPALGYAIWTSRRAATKVAWLALALVSVAGLCAHDPDYARKLVGAIIAFAYYLAAASLFFRLHRPIAERRIGKDTLFCLALLAYVAIPTLLFRALGILPVLVIGWFMTLAAYSYCVDASRQAQPPSLRDFLFFTFIDPALSLPERSRRASPIALGSVAKRIVSGAVLMTIGRGAVDLLPSIASATQLGASSLGTYGTTLLHGSFVFIAIYWLRAGLADVRIGMLEALGFRVPEAYDRPYLAKTPREFWGRWNLYVGRWARRYVFGPLALYLARRARKSWRFAPALLPQALAVIATFVSIGLLHDALNFAGESTTDLRFLKVFVSAAFALLAWEAAVLLGRAIPRPLVARIPPLASAISARVYLLHYLVLLVVVAGVI
jgi:D-alanyl-lipoteichoic acid acyltransferase DltB (MBOAT superfamily)